MSVNKLLFMHGSISRCFASYIKKKIPLIPEIADIVVEYADCCAEYPSYDLEDMEMVKNVKTFLIIGNRKSGKTVLAKDIMSRVGGRKIVITSDVEGWQDVKDVKDDICIVTGFTGDLKEYVDIASIVICDDCDLEDMEKVLRCIYTREEDNMPAIIFSVNSTRTNVFNMLSGMEFDVIFMPRSKSIIKRGLFYKVGGDIFNNFPGFLRVYHNLFFGKEEYTWFVLDRLYINEPRYRCGRNGVCYYKSNMEMIENKIEKNNEKMEDDRVNYEFMFPMSEYFL